MQSPRFSGRSLAALYLDQHFVAGVGNYLRSEILFYAGLHPWTKPKRLTSAALGKLARATLTLGRRAYDTGGITNPARRVAALRKVHPPGCSATLFLPDLSGRWLTTTRLVS